jgi:GTP cyclohydrolase FolE2
MLIREEMWDRIRDRFTEFEKQKLRAQVTGMTICPKGWTIDEAQLEEPLADKLKATVKRELEK